MAICDACKQEMLTATECTANSMIEFPDDRRLPPVPFGKGDARSHCPDCNVRAGRNHHPGCDREQCPQCHGQLISCSCEGSPTALGEPHGPSAAHDARSALESHVAKLTRVLFGPFARRVPMWMIVQDVGAAGICFVGASRDRRLRYGSTMTHQLILGELIARPHIVIESDRFRGQGLCGFLTQGADLEDWASRGRIVCDQVGRFADGRSRR